MEVLALLIAQQTPMARMNFLSSDVPKVETTTQATTKMEQTEPKHEALLNRVSKLETTNINQNIILSELGMWQNNTNQNWLSLHHTVKHLTGQNIRREQEIRMMQKEFMRYENEKEENSKSYRAKQKEELLDMLLISDYDGNWSEVDDTLGESNSTESNSKTNAGQALNKETDISINKTNESEIHSNKTEKMYVIDHSQNDPLIEVLKIWQNKLKTKFKKLENETISSQNLVDFKKDMLQIVSSQIKKQNDFNKDAVEQQDEKILEQLRKFDLKLQQYLTDFSGNFTQQLGLVEARFENQKNKLVEVTQMVTKNFDKNFKTNTNQKLTDLDKTFGMLDQRIRDLLDWQSEAAKSWPNLIQTAGNVTDLKYELDHFKTSHNEMLDNSVKSLDNKISRNREDLKILYDWRNDLESDWKFNLTDKVNLIEELVQTRYVKKDMFLNSIGKGI